MVAGFRKVGIVGLGLIGGSLALSLARTYPELEVVGVDSSQVEVDEALRRMAVSVGSTSLSAVAGCDLLIIATPVRSIVPVLVECQYSLAPGFIVTDVGSTKFEVAQQMAEAVMNGTYVGGHPMAGSERRGMEAASHLLFENAVYVLTPGDAPRSSVERLKSLLACTGALFTEMEAAAHDEAVAVVSHLPHIAASAVVGALIDKAQQNLLAMSGGGFRDTTRVASGDPLLWRDILTSNRDHVLSAITSLHGALAAFERALASSDDAELLALLSRSKALRDRLPLRAKSDLPPIFDIVMTLADEPGAINIVAGLLGENSINIVDIEILRVREGFGGTLRLGFATESDAEKAVGALRSRGFDVRAR